MRLGETPLRHAGRGERGVGDATKHAAPVRAGDAGRRDEAEAARGQLAGGKSAGVADAAGLRPEARARQQIAGDEAVERQHIGGARRPVEDARRRAGRLRALVIKGRRAATGVVNNEDRKEGIR